MTSANDDKGTYCYTIAWNSEENLSNLDMNVLSYLHTIFDYKEKKIGFAKTSNYVYSHTSNAPKGS